MEILTRLTNQWFLGILFFGMIACGPNKKDQSEEKTDNTAETPTDGFDKEKFSGAELTYSGTTRIGDDLEEYTFEFFHLDGSRPTVKINSKFEAELTKDANGDYYLTSSELAGGKFLNVGNSRMTYITNANQVFGSFYKN